MIYFICHNFKSSKKYNIILEHVHYELGLQYYNHIQHVGKEIYDKCWEIRRTRKDAIIFNQFDEFGNYLWHHEVTGSYIDDVLKQVGGKFKALVSATGSGGTIAAGDYLKKLYLHKHFRSHNLYYVLKLHALFFPYLN